MNKDNGTDEWFNMGYKKGVKEVFEITRQICMTRYIDNCIQTQPPFGQCNFESCPAMYKIRKYLEDVK